MARRNSRKTTDHETESLRKTVKKSTNDQKTCHSVKRLTRQSEKKVTRGQFDDDDAKTSDKRPTSGSRTRNNQRVTTDQGEGKTSKSSRAARFATRAAATNKETKRQRQETSNKSTARKKPRAETPLSGGKSTTVSKRSTGGRAKTTKVAASSKMRKAPVPKRSSGRNRRKGVSSTERKSDGDRSEGNIIDSEDDVSGKDATMKDENNTATSEDIGNGRSKAKEIIKQEIDTVRNENKSEMTSPVIEKTRNEAMTTSDVATTSKAETERKNVAEAIDTDNLQDEEIKKQEKAEARKKFKKWKTALMVAVVFGEDEEVEELIQKKVNLNATEKVDGKTALIFAACHGREKCIELLIRAGADVNKKDKDGKSALMHAAHTDWMRTMFFPFTHRECILKSNRHPMHPAHAKCVKLLVDAGSELQYPNNCGDRDNDMFGFDSDDEEVIERGGTYGIDMQDWQFTSTALIVASKAGCLECTKIFIEAGADVNETDENDDSAFKVAVETRNTEVCQFLIDHGADVNACGSTGYSPLAEAAGRPWWDMDNKESHKAKNQRFHMVTFLLKSGVKINSLKDDIKFVAGRKYSSGRHNVCTTRQMGQLLFCAGQEVENISPDVQETSEGKETSPKKEESTSDDETSSETSEESEELTLIPFEGNPSGLNLKSVVRTWIRRHLLEIDNRTNLFLRIPKLGLPPLMQKYLTFNCSLEPNA